MKKSAMALLLVFCSLSGGAAPSEKDEFTHVPFEERAAWWQEGKFGLFIHWGPYSLLAGQYRGKETLGEAEWIQKGCRIPIAEYEREVAAKFNPTNYDPSAWARHARDAGMNYMVMTTKHHDGFALFDSKVSTYDMVDHSPYGKDAIREYVDACRAEGLRVGFYYSGGWDWHYGTGNEWDPAVAEVDIDRYIEEKAVPQVRELFSNYGEIDILFWDMPAKIINTRERAVPLARLYELQPRMLVNNRLGGGLNGDYDTPEQHVPDIRLSDRPWQTCMTMNGTWGYRDKGEVWKSPKELVHKLMEIVSKGGNFLLNVGPKGDGSFPQKAVDRLQAIGKWIRRNGKGEHIYGTSLPLKEFPEWGYMTGRPGVLFATVFEWPQNGRLYLPGVGGRVKKAFLVNDPSRTFESEPGRDGLTLLLNGEPGDPLASVIRLEFGEEMKLWEVHVRADEKGVITLGAKDGDVHTRNTRRVEIDGETAMVGWNKPHYGSSWPLEVAQEGTYELAVLAKVGAEQDGNLCRFTLDGVSIVGALSDTKGAYAEFSMGTMKISPGCHRLHLVPGKPLKQERAGLMTLRKLILRPKS